MKATVIPFPLVRRRAFVRRQALRLANMSEGGQRRVLDRELTVQREALARKGVAPERIDAEVRALETAIEVTLASFLRGVG